MEPHGGGGGCSLKCGGGGGGGGTMLERQEQLLQSKQLKSHVKAASCPVPASLRGERVHEAVPHVAYHGCGFCAQVDVARQVV